MIANTSAEVVLFAITSAIKLGNNVRQSFVNNLQSQKLTLPLPNVDMTVDNFQITDFFTAYPQMLKENPKLKALYDKQENSNLDEAETKSYRDFFELGFSRENQDSTALVQGESLTSLLRFRQWANEEDAPVSGLRLVAGSLVEISVDYFVQVPSALNENSATGQSLKKILTSLDSVNFTSGNVKEALFKQVAPAIFTTAIETVNRLAPEISHDLKVQDFIQTATQGFVEDISGRLEGLQTEEESANIQQWGQWMFRSVIQNAGETVFAENSGFFTEKRSQI